MTAKAKRVTGKDLPAPELVPIKTVNENTENPRFIRDEKFQELKRSLEDFPQMANLRPLILDDDNVVLGGNMRLKAMAELGWTMVPVIKAIDLTPEQKHEFIIKDNVPFGQWDWDALANDYDQDKLIEWGLEIPGFDLEGDFGEDFELPDGEKDPFQQMTFTLADEQATVIQNALSDMKATDEYKYAETFGNENSNGNALYLIIQKWAEQKK